MAVDKRQPTERDIRTAHADFTFDEHGRWWAKFDLSKCEHNCLRIHVQAGPWILTICEDCGKTLDRECDHREYKGYPHFSDNVSVDHKEMNEAGTMLQCKVCGWDATDV